MEGKVGGGRREEGGGGERKLEGGGGQRRNSDRLGCVWGANSGWSWGSEE